MALRRAWRDKKHAAPAQGYVLGCAAHIDKFDAAAVYGAVFAFGAVGAGLVCRVILMPRKAN